MNKILKNTETVYFITGRRKKDGVEVFWSGGTYPRWVDIFRNAKRYKSEGTAQMVIDGSYWIGSKEYQIDKIRVSKYEVEYYALVEEDISK